MDTDKRTLLQKKLEENKLKLRNTKIEAQRKQIVDNIDDFHRKYRFADEAETERVNGFISRLNFTPLGHIQLVECEIPQDHNMYLCFLCGSEEMLNTYIYGNYKDLLSDMENWDFFSPYLLLVDEDLVHFVYVNDYGEIKGSKIE